jgi:uncharacterized OsmC-like protein
VTHQTGNQFEIDVRGHQVWVDQPRREDRGSGEAGPTPTELFVASLAACVGYYAAAFLRRQGLPYQGLRVDCDWAMRASQPARVGRVELRVTPPGAVPAELRAALHAAMEECTVHNSLRQPPPVTVSLVEAPPAERYARGEIDDEEYRRRLDALRNA